MDIEDRSLRWFRPQRALVDREQMADLLGGSGASGHKLMDRAFHPVREAHPTIGFRIQDRLFKAHAKICIGPLHRS